MIVVAALIGTIMFAFGAFLGHKDGYREGMIHGWHEAERHYQDPLS